MGRQEAVQDSLRACDKGDRQPCIGCAASAACADLRLACRAFRYWAQGNWLRAVQAEREPSRRHFLLLNNVDNGEET